jgi:thiol-disulfide isomerase/thioredoxin
MICFERKTYHNDKLKNQNLLSQIFLLILNLQCSLIKIMRKYFIALASAFIVFAGCDSKKQTETSSTDSPSTIAAVALTPTSVQDVSNKVLDFKDVTTKHKVTYIDFWASWCGPCRGEMPASQQLREEYKNKDVNFVYISLDEDKDDWASANKSFALPDGHSFVLPNPSGSEITSRFNISSIPRYVLIDSTGKVIDDNAPRPSETERIKQALDTMLK